MYHPLSLIIDDNNTIDQTFQFLKLTESFCLISKCFFKHDASSRSRRYIVRRKNPNHPFDDNYPSFVRWMHARTYLLLFYTVSNNPQSQIYKNVSDWDVKENCAKDRIYVSFDATRLYLEHQCKSSKSLVTSDWKINCGLAVLSSVFQLVLTIQITIRIIWFLVGQNN